MSDETCPECGRSLCQMALGFACAEVAIGRVRQQLAESERKLAAMTTERDDYRAGAQEEARRCDTLLAERNRARNETLAALERLGGSERKVARLEAKLTEAKLRLSQALNGIEPADWQSRVEELLNGWLAKAELEKLRGAPRIVEGIAAEKLGRE